MQPPISDINTRLRLLASAMEDVGVLLTYYSAYLLPEMKDRGQALLEGASEVREWADQFGAKNG